MMQVGLAPVHIVEADPPVDIHFDPRLLHGREVCCLSCARTLAVLVVDDAGERLLPPPGTQGVLLTRSGRTIRCRRCGGFAFLERQA